MTSGRNAFVSGRGAIADAIVACLADDGYEVQRLSDTASRAGLLTYRGQLADFGDDSSIESAVRGLKGSFDAIVLSHGEAETGTLATVSAAAWRRGIDINLTSVYVFLHILAPRLAPGARVVVVSSTAGLDRSKNSGPQYTASKAGLNGLVRHLASEFAAGGMRINAVCPGLIDDEMAAGVNTPETFARAVDGIPLRRPGLAEEVAATVSFLLSDSASYVTGALIPVAGGTHG
jgi:NAD(P)-dependent dehydrogenase (short-subunit alcohol dehydrogenase family)